MWPIIIRELRAGSRRWTTYWLRLLGAVAVLTALMFWSVGMGIGSPRAGGELFAHMHRVLLISIWVLVPLMVCDCISQERREGTLGLLFLTGLRSGQIVCAKTFTSALQAVSLWIAVLPITAVPLLLGGVGWKEVLFSAALTLASVNLATAAGIGASPVGSSRGRAVATAFSLSCLFFVVFGMLMGSATIIISLSLFPAQRIVSFSVLRFIESNHIILLNLNDSWRHLFGGGAFTPRGQYAFLAAAFCVAGVCFLILLAVAALAALQLRRDWQDKPKTKRQTEVEAFFFAPVFWTSLFRRWMRFSLERNPIGWLERRTWTGRIAALIWLTVMISFASAAVSYTSAFRGEDSMLNVLMWMLLFSTAYVAAGSFRRERETGALELILVTTLNERQILSGRLRGIWIQFLPAFAVWLAIVIYLYSWEKSWNPASLIRFTMAYVAVPVIGLYFSLRSRFVLLSWFATLAVGFALPQVIWWTLHYMILGRRHIAYGDPGPAFVTPFVQVAIASFLLWRLQVNLRRRSFAFR